jgi:hypothetical protein
MSLHVLSARRLGDQLSSGAVSPKEQAFYLSAGFILWLVPGYLFIVPPPNVRVWLLPFGLWFYEGLVLVMIYVFGVLYCLARCHVEPKKNFLIDFSCLFAPISFTTLVMVWGLFHMYASFIPWWLQGQTFDSTPPKWLEFIYSTRIMDLMRFFAVVGTSFFILVRIGNHMERISGLRMSANHTVERDGLQPARSSP